MFNVILIQNTTEGIARAMTSYETLDAAKSAAYLELAQIGVSETLVSVKVLVVDDNLNTLILDTNTVASVDPVVGDNEEA